MNRLHTTAAGATVTLNAVSFSSDSAFGGNGGHTPTNNVDVNGGGGGGGGLSTNGANGTPRPGINEFDFRPPVAQAPRVNLDQRAGVALDRVARVNVERAVLGDDLPVGAARQDAPVQS